MHINAIIRFFGLLIYSIYIYIKILNIKDVKLYHNILTVLVTLVVSIPLSFTFPLYELVFILYIITFVYIVWRGDMWITISSAFIAIGMSLGIDIFFQIVALNIYGIATMFIATKDFIDISRSVLYAIIVFVSTFLFIYFLFKTKALKKGFVFLKIREANIIAVMISILIIFSRVFWSNLQQIYNFKDQNVVTFYFAILTICCVLIINFWWKYNSRIVYQSRIKDRTIDELQTELDKLYDCNKFLSETLHRDNKLIPAMHSSLKQYLYNENANKIEGYAMLNDLDQIMKERNEEVKRIFSHVPKTGVNRIDSIISYMHSKALEQNITLDIVITADISLLINDYIAKQELEIMLADLLENAIIATSFAQSKKIILTISYVNNIFELTLHDSGIPFEPKTLYKLGNKRATTHLDMGGTGIGYIKIFEILKAFKASIIIRENTSNIYTKSITIRFDNESKYIIYTDRLDELKLLQKREDVLVFKR